MIFFKQAKEDENKYYLNTEIWNNHKVVGITGYSIEMLKKPLYDLALFIEDSLEPNRLDKFYLENIKTLKNNIK